MKLTKWAVTGFIASAGLLVYGALVEANRLQIDRLSLRLKDWPVPLDGFCIAVLADLHVRDRWSLDLARRACEQAVQAGPNVIVLPGDFVAAVNAESLALLDQALQPLAGFKGPMLASYGNHDHEGQAASDLTEVLNRHRIRVLSNEATQEAGITWVGIDSATLMKDDQKAALKSATGSDGPKVVLWHEPDMVDELEPGASLMIAGHSHGGQFRFPGGFTPMHTKLGKKYPRGFYRDAPTPLYVSRGVGTTGPPSRLNCPPELSLLTISPAD